jgi:simple sugar transport system permease protein
MHIVFEKRKTLSRKAILLVPLASFFISLLLAAILLTIFKTNPFVTFAAMFKGAFGTWPNFTETLVKAIPLMLTGLGVLIAFRLKFWNIGAEGQLTFGGIAATWVVLFWSPFLSPWMVLPVSIMVGMLAGALWAGIPAFLKVSLKVDEVLTTLMLNYVAILFAEHLYYGPWRDPKGYGFPGTPSFPEFAWLPRIAGRAHLGLIFALVLAALIWFILNRTRWGFELKIIGSNPSAAQCQGINIARNVMIALLFAGALSGLAGVCEVTGISRRLQQGLSIGYGYGDYCCLAGPAQPHCSHTGGRINGRTPRGGRSGSDDDGATGFHGTGSSGHASDTDAGRLPVYRIQTTIHSFRTLRHFRRIGPVI